MKIMKMNIFLAAMLTVAIPALAASEPASADETGPIPIGVNIELSGRAAVQGEAYSCAVKIVANEINKKGVLGGRDIKLIVRDNRSNPTDALQVAKQLVQNKHVVAMVGGGSSPTTLSLVNYVDTVGLPTVSMGSSTAIITPVEKRPYVFKTPANTEQVLAIMMQDFKRTGVDSMGLLAVDNPYGDAGIKAVKAAAKAGKLKLTGVETFSGDDRNLTAQVINLNNGNPDAIVVWSIPPGSGIAARDINYSGFDGKVYFDAGAGAELFLRGAGASANGILMVHPTALVAPQAPKSLPNYQVMNHFYDTYTQKCGAYSGFASYAADALNLIVHAIKKAGSTDRDAIRDALETLHYTGITGVYNMSAKNHGGLATDSLSVVTVHDGKWKLVSP